MTIVQRDRYGSVTGGVAATAELAGLVVLHRNKDFDVIAEVTGRQLEWLRLDE